MAARIAECTRLRRGRAGPGGFPLTKAPRGPKSHPFVNDRAGPAARLLARLEPVFSTAARGLERTGASLT